VGGGFEIAPGGQYRRRRAGGAGAGTVLTLVHSGLADQQDAAGHEQGRRDRLARLEEALKA